MSAAGRISVAIATYNGARFLEAQLESVLSQRVVPHEVVVSDDGSCDETVEIIRAVAAQSPTPFVVLSDQPRLGVTANFERAIARTTGDVVALADQDDVWRIDKLEKIADTFARDPATIAVFSDAQLIDDAGTAIGRTLYQSGGFTRRERRLVRRGRGFDALLHWNFVTGATLAFRSQLKNVVLPIPDYGLHDVWIALLASAAGELRSIDEPLIGYRVHDANVQGVPSPNPLAVLKQRRQRDDIRTPEVQHYGSALQRMIEAGVGDDRQRRLLEGKIAHLRFRLGLPPSHARRAFAVASHAARGDYGRFARGVRSVIYDTLYG